MSLIEMLKVLRRHAYLMLGRRDDADAHLAVLLTEPGVIGILRSLALTTALKMLYDRLPRAVVVDPDPALGSLCALPFYNRGVVVLVAVQRLDRAAAVLVLSIPEQAVDDLLVAGVSTMRQASEVAFVDAVQQGPSRQSTAS